MKRIFIDGLSGMAQGLFATLIIGTIIQQIGLFVGGDYGNLIYMIGKVAAGLTGAGIGVGVARKLEAQQLVTVSAAVAGMIICVKTAGRTTDRRWQSGAGRAGRAAGSVHCCLSCN
mgnify:CR=1 FL=1